MVQPGSGASDPLARFARVSPSRGGDYARNVRALFSPSVWGRAAEGGRGSLTRHLKLELGQHGRRLWVDVFDEWAAAGRKSLSPLRC
jgi:hypothetical protein